MTHAPTPDELAREQFGLAVQRLRGERSQALIAEAAGLDQATISLVERGRRTVTIATLLQLAAGLEVPATELAAQHAAAWTAAVVAATSTPVAA